VDGDLISMICESLGFMQNPNFCSTLRAALPFPVQFDNDARIISMGEAYFGGHGQPRRLLSLTLGTGIGFSMVVEGRLQEKSSVNHLAGHIPIRPGARKCFCGFSGCLESLVSASALVECFQRGRNEILSSTDITEVDSRAILEAAESGSPAALQAVHQILNDLLLGLNGYIYLFAPEVIVLGGGMAQGLHPWLGNLQKGLFAHPYDGYSVDIHLSELKEDAGLFGAASLWAPGYYLSYKDYYK
jgi:predicted NBD/HSP70 family sugar kinase